MSLIINHNMMAQSASRHLNESYDRLGKSVARLSSGRRVNSSADDAAGLAIRELMRAEVKGLNQGVRNANDAISLIQTADGSLGIIDEKLIRMKELAEQAATGTYSSDQRLMIESEYQQMASEITRISNATSFNGIHLLNGKLSSNVHNGAGLEAEGKLKIHFGTGNDSSEDYYYVTIGDTTASALGVGNSAYRTSTDKQTGYKKGDTYWDEGNSKWVVATADATGGDENKDFKIQKQVKSDSFTVSTQEAAQKALEGITSAIRSKDQIRAHLGAMQNRLENTINNLTIQSENLSSAESRISDADVSTEMTEFVRNQVVTQSAVAMLGQANSLPKMAMQLIQGAG